MNDRCRACSALLPEDILIRFENMPKSAQLFPVAESVINDTGVSIILKECRCCGLVQAIGDPVPYYRDVIRASAVSTEMKEFREHQFRNWVDKYGLLKKRVIEIGRGDGGYLEIAKFSGADVCGLEHDQTAVKTAINNGLKMNEGYVENNLTEIKGAPYDGFFCLNFLEHIPKPAEFLQGIANNLSDEGVGLVEVPNFDMMLDKSMYSEFIQDHLSYFTSETLVNLLCNNGFEVVSIKEIWYRYILSAEVKKRKKTNVDAMSERLIFLKQKVHSYLESCKNRGIKVASWGAGHQALANLSLLNMADDIEYVIDSAKFKQNKLTPATHINIVAPEILDKSDVGAIIIMAGGYSQEISSFLKRTNPQIERSILGDDFNVM